MSGSPFSFRLRASAAWGLVLAAPALWVGVLIWRNGVDVPFWDQWDGICPLFEKMAAGTLGPADFFALHNEHRPFFPRLLLFGLARLTGWNIRAELGLIWLLVVVCALNLRRLAQLTGWSGVPAGRWLLLAAIILLFTPLQFENWLLGFQVVLVLPVFCLTAALIVAQLRSPASFIGTMVLSTISTFSVAGGFFCWLLCLPLLLEGDGGSAAAPHRRTWWALWIGGFALNLILYFHGYHGPAGQADPLLSLTHPAHLVEFGLAFLGAPFAFGSSLAATTMAVAAGFTLLLLFVFCLGYVVRRRVASVRRRTLPWLLLAAAAVINAGLSACGRSATGLSQALASRYVIFSVLLPIGLLFALAVVWEDWRGRHPERTSGPRNTLICLTTAFVLMHLSGAFVCLRAWTDLRHVRLRAKALVELVNQIDAPADLALYVHAEVSPLKGRVNLLAGLGYLRPGLIGSPFIRDLTDPAHPGGAANGELQQAGRNSAGQLVLSGWAILPERTWAADAVLLTYDDPQYGPRIFALALGGSPHPDLATRFQVADFALAGWTRTFDPGQLPPGPQILRAWAFDPENGRAYALAGSVHWQP